MALVESSDVVDTRIAPPMPDIVIDKYSKADCDSEWLSGFSVETPGIMVIV